jgi:hypothetical protein
VKPAHANNKGVEAPGHFYSLTNYEFTERFEIRFRSVLEAGLIGLSCETDSANQQMVKPAVKRKLWKKQIILPAPFSLTFTLSGLERFHGIC